MKLELAILLLSLRLPLSSSCSIFGFQSGFSPKQCLAADDDTTEPLLWGVNHSWESIKAPQATRLKFCVCPQLLEITYLAPRKEVSMYLSLDTCHYPPRTQTWSLHFGSLHFLLIRLHLLLFSLRWVGIHSEIEYLRLLNKMKVSLMILSLESATTRTPL